MIVSIIVAMDEKNGIGKNNRLPWYLPSDLKRFKSITMGHHIIMGRKTYESIGKTLPGRISIIVTRNKRYKADGCIIIDSITGALDIAEKNNETEVFIIGGSEIFNDAFEKIDKIYLTKVHTDSGADVFFPNLDENEWEVAFTENYSDNERDEFCSDFSELLRKH